MGIKTIIGNFARNFNQPSTWAIVGDGDEGPEFEFGAQVWAVGKIELSVATQPFHQLEITNNRAPNAGKIRFEGKYLPNWPRLYKFDLCTVKVNAGLGISTVDSPLKFSASVSQEATDSVTGFDVWRHPSAGAPDASGIAGDPIGILGLGMAASAGGGTDVSVINAGSDTTIFMFRSNLQQVAEDLSRGRIASAAARSLGGLLLGNHLKFFYSGAMLSTALNIKIGTEFYTAGFSGGVSLNAVWVSALHLFILKPGEDEHRYVYSRHCTLRGASGPYKNPSIKGPRWEQKWL